MAKRTPITAEYVRERLDYDPETGVFTWKRRPNTTIQRKRWNGRYAGKVAGTLSHEGYVHIGLDHQWFSAHWLAWVWVYGTHPKNKVDHIDRKRWNNRIDNLRLATDSENARHCGIPSHNTSGVKGIWWEKDRGLWRAAIRVDRKLIYLGRFPTKDAAHAAYVDAAKRFHGEFACTG